MPLNPLQVAGAGASAIGGLVNIFSGLKMQREARNIKPDYYGINDPRLSGMESQYAKQMLGRAQMQANARMPGAAARERQLQTAAAGTQAAISRGVVDPTMAMQSILASQTMADDQINNQFMQEAQMQQQREANLMGAQQTMISERDKAMAEKMAKFQMDMSQKNALRSAGQQAISSGIGAMAGTLTGLGGAMEQSKGNKQYMGLLERMYGGGGGTTNPTTYTPLMKVPSLFNTALSQRSGSMGMSGLPNQPSFRGKLG